MTSRAIILVALVAFLFGGIAQADDAAILVGGSLKPEEAVSKSDAVFVGEVTDTGIKVMPPPDCPYEGPLYRGIKIKVLQFLRGSVRDHVSVALFVPTMKLVTLHMVGNSYIFFVQTKSQKALDYPYNCLEKADTTDIAIKLLPATDENIATVKKLISN